MLRAISQKLEQGLPLSCKQAVKNRHQGGGKGKKEAHALNDVTACDIGRAARRSLRTGQHVEGGRLSRPVWPQETKTLVIPHDEGDIVHHDLHAVLFLAKELL